MNRSDGLISVQVYKSASKRKAHILKNHPGAELPPSIRKLRPAAPGEPDPMLSTHTQLTGTIATAPVCCPHCAKQYSSKVSVKLCQRRYFTSLGICINIYTDIDSSAVFAVIHNSTLCPGQSLTPTDFCVLVSQTKMVQHIRKKHPEFAQLANTIQAPLTTAVISSAPAVISADGTTAEAVVVRKS